VARIPRRVDAATKAGLLDLVDGAVEAGWSVASACRVLELGELRAWRWLGRRAGGALADRTPGGSPMHGLLAEEVDEIVALFHEWGETDRSHRKLAHRGSYSRPRSLVNSETRQEANRLNDKLRGNSSVLRLARHPPACRARSSPGAPRQRTEGCRPASRGLALALMTCVRDRSIISSSEKRHIFGTSVGWSRRRTAGFSARSVTASTKVGAPSPRQLSKRGFMSVLCRCTAVSGPNRVLP
jgi:hypothetical protein